MKILLVYSKMPSSFWTMNHTLKILGKAAWYPPLGLLTIASMLPKTWQIRLLDLNVEPLSDEDIRWADQIFISAMNVQELSARTIIKRCSDYGKTVVAGGSLFTLQSEQFPGVDHFILNEAEITLPQYLSDLEHGSLQKVYRSDDFAHIGKTPLPRWDLIDLNRYQYGIIQYSRGCPYHCDFCDVPTLYGNRPRMKSPAQIIAELDIFRKESTVPSILFADDNLIGNRKVLKQDLLPALIKWRRQHVPIFSFSTQVSINLVDDVEMMDLMLEAGFRHLFIGIETDNEDTLKLTGKSQNTRRDILESIAVLHRKGFIVVGGFIVGFDTDTVETFQTQADLIQKSGIMLATLNMLKAPPGTPLFERMESENRLIPGFSFHEAETNIALNIPSKLFYQTFQQTIQQVYSPTFSSERAKQWLTEFNHLPAVETDIPTLNTFEYLPVLFRAIYFIGIKYSGRKYFWRLLWWAVRHRPRLLDWALVETIFIYQLDNLLAEYSRLLDEKVTELSDQETLSISSAQLKTREQVNLSSSIN
ncbi:MAG: B12-binding domain-containing radical SAM protein [Lentisphaeria bacterium]|nr:B12-binding domain-containing radical SAM protein [Candidatus Neomarinimicrobiota bacterium]MCF7842236.1 B12-binding domain-containing radical SAM protein [Lentisphaeria bacterium]